MVAKKVAGPAKSEVPVNTQVTETDLKHHSQELGYFGSLFGSKENAPVYIAGLIAVIALFGAIGVGIWGPTPERAEYVKMLGGIVIAALSFIGGASGRNQS
ncbi:hypothetical protein [Mesorhizobium helmanticense]|uniref:Uncharacterized protein n=1 Tax=Mesorhizobium helmanticense TaxID=1776423 RepID=A0A2T4IWZ5_9HYPH|nr:hypothetical protein [Mesorhizobium helmanticense]PTE10151.1 hypothetical protein C9427_11400 [Mesorhizobium helmanticense]